MDAEFKFCGNCGTKNSRTNNFCTGCGDPLNLIQDPSIQQHQKEALKEGIKKDPIKKKPKEKKHSSDYENLFINLGKFKTQHGWFIVNCNDYSIKLSRCQGSYKLFADIDHLSANTQTYITDLAKHGFIRHDRGLRKTYVLSNFDEAAAHITDDCKTVFEDVFLQAKTSSLSIKESFVDFVNVPGEDNGDGLAIQNKDNSIQAKKGCIPILIVVGLLILMFKFCGRPDSYSTGQDLSSSDMKLNAFVYCQKYVKQNLTNPKSADFATNEYSCSVSLKDSLYFITSYVDSENAFGGVVRNKFVATMIYIGGDPDLAENWQFGDVVFLK